MVVIEFNQVKKCFGERVLLEIPTLKIMKREKIGLVGRNGCGKTTLLNIIANKVEIDRGEVIVRNSFSYVEQLAQVEEKNRKLSGGEKTKEKIKKNMNLKQDILLIDEPTNHLDEKNILEVEEKLSSYSGTLVLISHDRKLLDAICTSIIEIDQGRVRKYKGNYSDYQKQKEKEIEKEELEYRKYREEKVKIEKAISIEQNYAKSVRKAPRRMGNSEARLCGRRAEESREKLEGHKKALQMRLDKLETKEKPKKQVNIYMNMNDMKDAKSKYALIGENIHIQFDDNVVLEKENFHLLTNQKVALIGENGVGKTCLFRSIMEKYKGIRINSGIRIGYFSQELDELDTHKTIMENVLEKSIKNEKICRNVLGSLLFQDKEVYKKVEVLSGGERVKVALAQILVSDANMLILDEVTNFLDIPSMEALERLMQEFQGTILFTSHDRAFVNSVANSIWIIKNKKIIEFNGRYTEYLKREEIRKNTSKEKENDLVIDMKIAAINSRLAIVRNRDEKKILEKEYWELISRKKK